MVRRRSTIRTASESPALCLETPEIAQSEGRSSFNDADPSVEAV